VASQSHSPRGAVAAGRGHADVTSRRREGRHGAWAFTTERLARTGSGPCQGRARGRKEPIKAREAAGGDGS
jgi:hypothetical protein